MAIETTSDLSSVVSSQIVDGAVTSAKIADNAVVAAKIAAGAVGSAALASGAVVAASIAAGAVGSAALASGAVVAASIAAAAVGTAAISSGSATSGQILQANGSGAVTFATPAAGGGMTLIATATPSGASTVSFTSIPSTYKHLILIVAEAYQNSTSDSWSLRFNNSSSNYSWNGISIATSNDVGAETSGNALPGLGYHNHAPIQRTTSTSTTYDRHGRAHVLICRYSEAENKTVFWTSQGYAQSSIGYNSAICSGQWRDTTAIDRVDLVRNATQTVTGTIYLYGVS